MDYHRRSSSLKRRGQRSNDPNDSRNKMTPNWERPYRVLQEIRVGTYRLKTLEGVTIPRTWHVLSLRKFYM